MEYVQGMLSIARFVQGSIPACRKRLTRLSPRPDISKTMLRFLQEIVVSLVEESATMPPGVLDCLLGQVTGSKDVSLPIALRLIG